jgi:transposase-like protein
LKTRGLVGPNLAVGDGALGFWGAVREVFPATGEQRCLVHKTANVLAALPKRIQPAAKTAIVGIYNAETRTDAISAVRAFADALAEHPKATKKITGKLDTLLAFYDYPTEHWIHLRTTNPIESTFSTVRLRTRVTRGAGSRQAALAMAYKLLDAAQDRWRKINAPHLVPAIRADAVLIDGHHQERTTDPTINEDAAA